MWVWIYRLLQCTWGLPQTLVGLAVFLGCRRAPHQGFHGAVHTRWSGKGGISLGLFIFTPDSGDDWGGDMVWHEYGHTYQSLMLGPLYLLVIGLPSLIWCNCFEKYRNINQVPYSAFYAEKWADALGAGRRKRLFASTV